MLRHLASRRRLGFSAAAGQLNAAFRASSFISRPPATTTQCRRHSNTTTRYISAPFLNSVGRAFNIAASPSQRTQGRATGYGIQHDYRSYVGGFDAFARESAVSLEVDGFRDISSSRPYRRRRRRLLRRLRAMRVDVATFHERRYRRYFYMLR